PPLPDRGQTASASRFSPHPRAGSSSVRRILSHLRPRSCCKVGNSGIAWRSELTHGPGWRGSSHLSTPVQILSGSTAPDSFPEQRTPRLAFRGQYEHSLDSKDRLTVPARFRAALADGVVLSAGLDPCVEVYPTAEYAR